MTQTAKPYRQGFNKETGEILIVFTVQDVQLALVDRQTDKTVSEPDALAIMEKYEAKIIDGLLMEWCENLSAALYFLETTEYQKETEGIA